MHLKANILEKLNVQKKKKKKQKKDVVQGLGCVWSCTVAVQHSFWIHAAPEKNGKVLNNENGPVK